ncbi:MAG TPA: TetR/AcrR family transcriptional regulator [Gemmatimonadaceae bacterium]|nr:TetR/AcrR family transcriptional regulator [Gemmatimonadaceae bacterium]
MARPRTASDEDVFAAAFRVMQVAPPSGFTLQAVAREAGITAGALVQRFGSKRDLQIALAKGSRESTTAFLESLHSKSDDPLAALRHYADCMASLAASPAAIVRNFAYLQEDLSDPALRAELKRQGLATRHVLESLIRSAVQRGDLQARANPPRIARAIEAGVGGALLSWAIYRDGTAKAWLRAHLAAVVDPWRTPSRQGRPGS